MFQIKVGAESKDKVRLIVLDSKRVKMKWSHSVNPDNEQLDEAVDLEDIDLHKKDLKDGEDMDVSRGNMKMDRLPNKKKVKNPKQPQHHGRLSRSGLVKEDVVEIATEETDKKRSHKASKRRRDEPTGSGKQGDDEPSEESRDKKKKSKKVKKNLISEPVASVSSEKESAAVSVAGSSVAEETFTRDSGVVGVKVLTKSGNGKLKSSQGGRESGGNDSADVELSMLSGSSLMQGFGTGGGSAWD